jgi:hypothetical protein
MNSHYSDQYIQGLLDKLVSLSATVKNLGTAYHIVDIRYAEALHKLAAKESEFSIDAQNTNNLIALSLVTVKTARAAVTLSTENIKLLDALDTAVKAVEKALSASEQEVKDSQSRNA